MLTDEDIQKLIEAQEAVFVTKVELDEKIDELARIVEKGFNGTQKHMDERFDKIENQNHEVRIKRLEDALVIK